MMDADRRGDRRAADRRGAEKPAVDRIAAPAAAQPAEERRRNRRAVPEPSTAAIPGLRPDRKPGVPHPSGPIPSAPFPAGAHPSAPVPPLREDRDDDLLGDDRRSERRRPDRRSDQRKAGDRRTGEGRIGSRRSGDRTAEQAAPARERGARKAGKSAADDHPSTGPIPVVRPEDVDQDLDATPKESALAWLRFAGELIIALAAGVGVYFAATLLWEQLPHLAVFLAPLAVAGLVAGVSMWRQRQGREPVGIPVLALLVFAGTLLTIAPAAGLLAAAGT
jgi:hypothetical protein